jgi:hypothetical protein
MAIAMAAAAAAATARSFCTSSTLFLTVVLFSVRIWFMGLRFLFVVHLFFLWADFFVWGVVCFVWLNMKRDF